MGDHYTPRPDNHPSLIGTDPPALTPKLQMFADEWLTGDKSGKRFNCRTAAEVAGYSTAGQNPSQRGSKLLRHPAVKAYIDKMMEDWSMSAGEVLARFTDLARAEVGDVVKIAASGNHVEYDLQKIVENKRFIKNFGFDSNGQPKVEFHDAVDALKQIARIRGMLKDGLELSGPGGGSVPVTMTVQFVNPDGSTVNPVPNNQNALPAPAEDFSEFDDEEAG